MVIPLNTVNTICNVEDIIVGVHMVFIRWLGVTLNLLGSMIVFMAAMMMVGFRDILTAGLVGLALSYAVGVNICLSKCAAFNSVVSFV